MAQLEAVRNRWVTTRPGPLAHLCHRFADLQPQLPTGQCADANALIQVFGDTWYWALETERLFRDILISVPTAVADVMQELRTLAA